jgi:histone-lysine N-methyltransferase SETD2
MPEKIYDQNSRYKDTNFTPKVNTKYMQYLPQSIQPHVEKIYDVSADGHCGFRATAFCLGRGQEDYMAIRKELSAQIKYRRKFYEKEGTFPNIEWSLSQINARSNMPCTREHHMAMPSMGEAMADAFETPVFYFAKQGGSQTCFPHSSPPNSNPPIFIAYIEIGEFKHFVALKLKDPEKFPAPRYLKNWERSATDQARGWAARYARCFNWEGN